MPPFQFGEYVSLKPTDLFVNTILGVAVLACHEKVRPARPALARSGPRERGSGKRDMTLEKVSTNLLNRLVIQTLEHLVDRGPSATDAHKHFLIIYFLIIIHVVAFMRASLGS